MKNGADDKVVGLGDRQFTFAVYIANQPEMPEYALLNALEAIRSGDIDRIGQVCGNGWRKVFNVYAKLLYALDTTDFTFSQRAPTWQIYRDRYLLQADSGNALIFSPPSFDALSTNVCQVVQIICGKTYAKQLIQASKVNLQLTWVDDEFAIDLEHNVIVCPYFDYRQLSNYKIQRLSTMLSGILRGVIKDII